MKLKMLIKFNIASKTLLFADNANENGQVDEVDEADEAEQSYAAVCITFC